MKRSIPWLVAVVALVASGVLYFQLHKARLQLRNASLQLRDANLQLRDANLQLRDANERYSRLADSQVRNHLHYQVREFIIRAKLADADHPIVIIGDSITEMARLPEMIGGKPVVNAGIGGASIEDFQTIAPELLGNSKPPLVAVALGTNDSGSNTIERNYAALLSVLKTLSPRLLAIGVTPQVGADAINSQIKAAAESAGVPFVEEPLPAGSRLADHIHLNAAGYRNWTPALVSAIRNHLSG